MPAEFESHEATIMIFPERPGSWPYQAKKAAEVFSVIIRKIAECEKVYVVVSDRTKEKALKLLGDLDNVRFLEIPTDDAWARDTAPTFVKNDKGLVRGISWRFNAWGGEVDGLYRHFEKDDALAVSFCDAAGFDHYDAGNFVLEGGSIHSNGAGTLLVTESCLLSKGRNPGLSKAEIEERLRLFLGAEHIIWLPRGIYNDETNEHVDNVATFLRPGEVVLAWTEDETDPQYPLSVMDYEYLSGVTDAKGRKLRIHKLPIPRVPVCYTEEEVSEYDFEPGEDIREPGERLAASYVNFYYTNRSILIPGFGGENEESDRLAAKLLGELCPERDVIPIPARPFILGGGNIHCLTQQIPEVKPE